MHPTFHNPVREVLQHPFEIEEHGWGEFELSVVVRHPSAWLQCARHLFHGEMRLACAAQAAAAAGSMFM